MTEFSQIIEHISRLDFAGLSPIALFFVFFFATFISEDAACLTAGALAGQEKISFALALTACFTGIFIGDVLLYWTGRIFGDKILQTRTFSRFISENAVKKASVWLEKRAATAVFVSRFIVGLRLPTYFAAGFLRTDFLKFTFYFLLASAIWTPILVSSTAFSQKILFSENVLFDIILSFIFLKILLHFLSWKNRRLFIGRLKRIRNWEFWSLPVFYFPVICYILWLAIKHRSLTVFTCANPAIPAGGFVGESKHEIYKGLQKSRLADDFLLKYIFLPGNSSLSKKVSQVWQFVDAYKLNFPLVLKPNIGERGKDVKIVRNFPELQKGLKQIKKDYILQEFAKGVEVSIFYYRYPKAKKGEIFSITEKRFPVIMGDGNADLETLILRDKRAICLAKCYFAQNQEKLEMIPAKGEEVRIIDIGTHSRGAIFLDGEWLKTKKLESKIDEICRGFQGFYFGRFDIKAKSHSDLQNGKNFKIIELNGVTSESTNIYDPKFSLPGAYRILFKQWRIAFEIGLENHKLRVKLTPFRDLIKLIFGKPISQHKLSLTDNQTTDLCV